jgi:hypothetical protein
VISPRAIRVAWVFGLARSGSSITAYAGAHAFGAPVADEIMGPWDRTGPPYHYPPEQARLAEAFKASQARLTPEIAGATRSLLATIAGDADRIVCKHPHLRFTPAEFAEQFADHTGVWLIRNPLRRLASIHARGWTQIIRPNHDLDYFREYAERWLSMDPARRVVFEDLRRDPREYFRRVFQAWDWPCQEHHLGAATAYQQGHYHGRSGEQEPEHSPRQGLSERARTAPEPAVDLYLSDPFMRDLFERCGWPLRRGHYTITRAQRLRRALGSMRRRLLPGPSHAP